MASVVCSLGRVHEAIEKSDGGVFRCSLSGSDTGCWLEVPAWMFNRSACARVRLPTVARPTWRGCRDVLNMPLRDALTALAWSEIEVIDDDLGRSAAGRSSVPALRVAQVCLGKVGASPRARSLVFARNNRDWQQLIEMCRTVGTALIDRETSYIS
jgi:hypothetical protein